MGGKESQEVPMRYRTGTTKCQPLLEKLLKGQHLRIRENVRAELRKLSRSKKRSLVAPLLKLAQGKDPRLQKLMRPIFEFEDHQTWYGAVIRIQTTLLIKVVSGLVHVLSIVDNDQVRDKCSRLAMWLEKFKFEDDSRMYICILKNLIVFLAIFARSLPGKRTRYVWSFEKNRSLLENEIEQILRGFDAEIA